MKRLESLPAFQRWTVGRLLRMADEVEAEAEGTVECIRQDARALAEALRREAVSADERAQAQTVMQFMRDYFKTKGDTPSANAIKAMEACTSPGEAQAWLKRAYAGEKSIQIFPKGESRPKDESR